jgi:hypothetical protein
MTMYANELSRWLRQIALLIALTTLSSSVVSAQTVPPAERNLDTALARAAAAWLTTSPEREGEARFDARHVTVRQSDSLVNGALIGAGVALASGLFMCRAMEPWDVCLSGDQAGSYITFGAIGAGIGIGIDALIRKKITIHETPGGAQLSAAPLVGRHGAGLRMSLSF